MLDSKFIKCLSLEMCNKKYIIGTVLYLQHESERIMAHSEDLCVDMKS